MEFYGGGQSGGGDGYGGGQGVGGGGYGGGRDGWRWRRYLHFRIDMEREAPGTQQYTNTVLALCTVKIFTSWAEVK